MAGRLWALGESVVDYARDIVQPHREAGANGSGAAMLTTQRSSGFVQATASQPLVMQSSGSLTGPADISGTPAVGGSDVMWHPQVGAQSTKAHTLCLSRPRAARWPRTASATMQGS